MQQVTIFKLLNHSVIYSLARVKKIKRIPLFSRLTRLRFFKFKINAYLVEIDSAAHYSNIIIYYCLYRNYLKEKKIVRTPHVLFSYERFEYSLGRSLIFLEMVCANVFAKTNSRRTYRNRITFLR